MATAAAVGALPRTEELTKDDVVIQSDLMNAIVQMSTKKSGRAKSRRRRKMLRTISGVRTFATLWIVLGHFQDTNFRFKHDTSFLLILSRGFVAVGIYIVLSGFMTHYAYHSRRYDTWRSWCAFYLRRVGRVLFTYEVSCFLGLCDPLFTRHDALITKYPLQALSTCMLIQSWFEVPSQDGFTRDFPNSPNAGGWTISTLLFAWLLYPLMNGFMRRFNRATSKSLWAKLCLAALMYVLAMLPCIILYAAQGGIVSYQQFELLYKYPILRLPDFVIGVIVAELVNDPRVASRQQLWRFLPDLLTLGFGLFVCLCTLEESPLEGLPEGIEQPLIRENAETFLISGLAPVMAAILLGYGINSGRADLGFFSFTGLLEHRAIEVIGSYSFAVYCFQFTFFFMIEQWQYNRTGIEAFTYIPQLGAVPVPARLVAGYLMPYLLFLFLFAGAWTLWAEQPVAARLAAFSKRHFEGQIVVRQEPVADDATSKKECLANRPLKKSLSAHEFLVPSKAAVESYRARQSLTMQLPVRAFDPGRRAQSVRYFVETRMDAADEADENDSNDNNDEAEEEIDEATDSEYDDGATDTDVDIDGFMSFQTIMHESSHDLGLVSGRTRMIASVGSFSEEEEDEMSDDEASDCAQAGGSAGTADNASRPTTGWAFSTCA